jgi:hypothetical protein
MISASDSDLGLQLPIEIWSTETIHAAASAAMTSINAITATTLAPW